MSEELAGGQENTLTVENRGVRPEIRHMSDEEAGAAISNLFGPPPVDRKRDEKGRFTKAEQDALDAQAEQAEAAPPPASEKADEAPADTEQADAEPTEGDEASSEELRFDPAKYGKMLVPIKVNGVEEWVPIEEVRSGYSRTKDYTQKTQAFAEERKKFEQEIANPLKAEREQLKSHLAALETIVQAAMPDREPDWDRLQNELTPEEFTAQWVNYRKNAERLTKVREQREALDARMMADAQRDLLTHLKVEEEKLKAAIPEFADAEKGKQLHDDLVAYAKSLGYSDDDLASVSDHRLLVVLNKARLYEQAQKSRTTAETKVDRALDKGLKPSGTAPAVPRNRLDAAKGRLAKSGSVEDAADAIGALLGVR